MTLTQAAPAILCPYLHDWEPAEVRAKFGLDEERGSKLDFFFWQDRERIGPERAFEHCWNQFPDRDIIIMHTDMAPMPGDVSNAWYDELLKYRDELPQAGMIACNLFCPRPDAQLPLQLQCGGGDFVAGKITYLHGPVPDGAESLEGAVSPLLLGRVRSVKWVTFGGVYISRELLRACGPFDPQYKWAYVMDVDYCFEARLRGFQLFQVPVSLQHEGGGTTQPALEQEPGLGACIEQNFRMFYEKWGSKASALDAIDTLPPGPGQTALASDATGRDKSQRGSFMCNSSPDPFAHPICLATPHRIAFSTWMGHVPFAMFLVDLLTPRVVVELGTYSGVSYCALCQAVQELQIGARCCGIDSWEGDPQCGFYGPDILADLRQHHDPRYGSFSQLQQTTFDAATAEFAPGSIDLLHIDGYHIYESVKHDFETWLPKLSSRGVVLLHDTNVRYADYGVWRYWEELSTRYPHFEFFHSCGLGVVLVGSECPEAVQQLCRPDSARGTFLRYFFSQAGNRLEELMRATLERDEARRQLQSREAAPPPPPPPPALPARDDEPYRILDALWNSASWRITRPARNLIRRVRGFAPEAKPMPATDKEAWQTVAMILSSVWWSMTSPLRLAKRAFGAGGRP